MVNLIVIGPCRTCARAGAARVEGIEMDVCVVHAVDAVERGGTLFIGARSLKAVQREGDKRQALRQRYGWS